MTTKKPDQDVVKSVLFLAFCAALFYGCFGPKPKYPHPPGSVLHTHQTQCGSLRYETDRMICMITKKDEWLATHPKSEWYWSEY